MGSLVPMEVCIVSARRKQQWIGVKSPQQREAERLAKGMADAVGIAVLTVMLLFAVIVVCMVVSSV